MFVALAIIGVAAENWVVAGTAAVVAAVTLIAAVVAPRLSG
jgi:hypothetical protein